MTVTNEQIEEIVAALKAKGLCLADKSMMKKLMDHHRRDDPLSVDLTPPKLVDADRRGRVLAWDGDLWREVAVTEVNSGVYSHWRRMPRGVEKYNIEGIGGEF